MIAGVTVSYKKVPPTRLDYFTMLNGKQISQGYDQLSEVRKSYTRVNWMVGKESEKTTAVYVKQQPPIAKRPASAPRGPSHTSGVIFTAA